MIKTLLVGGSFDDTFGRPSGYIEKLFSDFSNYNEFVPRFDIVNMVNGGAWSSLEKEVKHANDYDCIVWLCNVNNKKEKLLPKIKTVNPKCMLVSSKNNKDRKYGYLDLIGRALDSKSNLLLEFTGTKNSIETTMLDPLGNAFSMKETNTKKVAVKLHERLYRLSCFTRMASESVREESVVPPDYEFFDIVQSTADKFHELTHAVNQERFIGNASFRCLSGFPSMRKDDIIYVSRRNVDKRNIGINSFVPVELDLANGNPIVWYHGYRKPSVDTPVQLMLYRQYPRMRYCLHQHVYIESADMTESVVPCGAVEEFDEIKKTVGNDRNMVSFAVNLRGHGSLVMTSDLAYFKLIYYRARPLPEIQ